LKGDEKMNSDEKANKVTELMINAIDNAQTHKLDLNNKDDLKKILEAIDPQQDSGVDLNEFENLIQNADKFIETSAFRIDRKKSGLPN
jgi:hypothetical protein